MSSADDVRDRVQGLISEAMAQEGMVTRWVAAVEVMDRDGEVALWLAAADGMKGWQSLGMLEYAAQVERGGIIADCIGGDE